MSIKPIRNDDDLKLAFRRLEGVFQAEAGTAQADERDVLVALIESYENTTMVPPEGAGNVLLE